MLKYIFFFFLFLCSVFQINAQKSEQLYTHFDKPFYVSGEDIWYKVYFKNGIDEIQSGVVRVEWVAPNGQIIKQQKLKVKDNYALGDLAIPYDWKEGNYLFRAYTNYGLNFGKNNYFQKVVPIFNLLELPPIIARPNIDFTKGETVDLVALKNLTIALSFSKKIYFKRDSIDLIIKVLGKDGVPIKANLSLSITDGNYLPETVTPSVSIIPKITNQPANFSNQFEAEKGIILKGQLSDEKGQPLDTRFLSIYIQNTKQFLKATIENGELNLQLPDFEGSHNVQFFDMNPFHPPLPTIKFAKTIIDIPYKGKPLYRNNEAADYLFLLNKFRQYKETFKVASPDYKLVYTQQKQNYEPDKSYLMKKYKGLSDMASFVKEIIPGARVIQKGGKTSIRLRYKEKSIANRLPPWYIVNDWLTNDESIVLKLPFRDIDQIDMFNSKKRIATQLDPSMVSRGLLQFYTKDGKTPPEIIQKNNNKIVQGFYQIRTFPQNNKSKNSPDFRPVIYWNPTITTNENGEARIRFATSDAIGRFRVRVEGVSQGNIGKAEGFYKVILK